MLKSMMLFNFEDSCGRNTIRVSNTTIHSMYVWTISNLTPRKSKILVMIPKINKKKKISIMSRIIGTLVRSLMYDSIVCIIINIYYITCRTYSFFSSVSRSL